MTKIRLFALLALFFMSFTVFAQSRTEINIPDIPGFQTLKCDFHMHTVFSDGDVWPTIRVQEAWLEGLDAIAITDHIEYRPHSKDIDADHNRSFEIAKPLGKHVGLIVIRGTEITRNMPPGHFNAIFIKNANLIDREDWWEACVEAKEQGAFIFWNHPGWKSQQPDSTVWWEEHTRLLNAGIMHGIEVYNHHSYYPEALEWAKEKNLTVIANSDIHLPVNMEYTANEKRPVTLVFATERTEKGIHQALKEQNTAAYFEGKLVGDRKFLSPLFFNSIVLPGKPVNLKNNSVKRIAIKNNSDVTFKLKRSQPSLGFSCPDEVEIVAHKTTLMALEGASEELQNAGVLKMYYEIENLKTLAGEPLPVVIEIANK